MKNTNKFRKNGRVSSEQVGYTGKPVVKFKVVLLGFVLALGVLITILLIMGYI